MGIDIEIKHETVVACAAILFLIIDLFVVSSTIKMLFYPISNQQYSLTGMIAAHPTSASAYMWESLENQGINVIFAIAILLFLWYISKEPIGLLREMIKKKKRQIDDLKYKKSDHTNNKKPKY